MVEEFKFEIKKQLGVLSEGNWNMEINMVSWGDASPKLDIRKWNEDHTKMGKGISLTEEEYKNLMNILASSKNPFKKATKTK